jgi:(p)ppGpp synthase/HD superfamily hydrolase
MPDLERAIALAVEAHRGQSDKYGKPYILHPLTLMMKMEGETAMMAAVLHDVVEDTTLTLDDLIKEGFPADVVEAVDSLSKRESESYEGYIDRLSANTLAVKVKRADLEDNMRVTRMKDVTDKDLARLAKYLRAWQKLAVRSGPPTSSTP